MRESWVYEHFRRQGKSLAHENRLRMAIDWARGPDATSVMFVGQDYAWALRIPHGAKLISHRPDHLSLRFPNGMMVTYRKKK